MCAIEKEIEKYLSEIQNNLVGSNKAKKNIISEIEGFVYDYAEVKNVKDISDIYSHFGTPEEMASTYLSQSDPKKIVKAVKIKKAVVIGIIVALLMFAFIIIFEATSANNEHNGFANYEKITEETHYILE